VVVLGGAPGPWGLSELGKARKKGEVFTMTGKIEKSVLVGIIMGSDTDLPVMSESARTLEKFGIPYEIEVMSAHRSPVRTHEYASTAVARGLKCIIVGAGGAAHLAGVVAALTVLPVIAVPMATTVLNGIDSLLSIVQMPAGIPVATMAIDKPGAVNAAIFAAQIIGTANAEARRKLTGHKEDLARSVSEKNTRLRERIASSK
jgi:5-(carboxyamino)imidazole ribonucleotide mutase